MPRATETLPERAARLDTEREAVRQQLEAEATAQHRRLVEHQERFDREQVAAWDPKALDADADAAHAELRRVIAEHPITRAYAAVSYAERRRAHAWQEHLSTLSRMGRPVAGAQVPAAADLPDLHHLIDRAAQSASSERLDPELEDINNRRNTPKEK